MEKASRVRVMASALTVSMLAWSPALADVGTTLSVPHAALAGSAVQEVASAALAEGVREMEADGGAVVILDVETGQIMALASVGREGGPSEVPWHRAINNVQEVGNVMSIFAIAHALNAGLISEDTQIDTPPTLTVVGFTFQDYQPVAETMTAAEILLEGSYIGRAQIGRILGSERQQAFLDSLGLLEPHPLEVQHPTSIAAVRPSEWGRLSAMTVAAGHGLSASPLQIAAAYASLVNGGMRVHASFQPDTGIGERVISEETSAAVREMLRDSVLTGTASLANVPGYSVGGASGSSDLRLANGEYDQGRFVATFAAVFPSDAPRYVVVTQLEDPVYRVDGEERRTAGWTVVQVAGRIIDRVGY
jgi:cell division protein FtsI (penicillin-binding protein 3)